jgi:4'-phosphopantetheinyl transferase
VNAGRVGWLVVDECELPSSDGWLSAAERSRARSMPFEQRRRDFLLGRLAARRALSGWMPSPLQLASLEIRAAPDGAPEALVGGAKLPATISLSHRDGCALCAVARPEVALGADLERIEPRSLAFVSDFFTEAEQTSVLRSSLGRDLAANLIWSAKECAAKALRQGLRLDTRTLAVELLDSAAESGWRRFQVRAAGATFWGLWRTGDGRVVTIAADAPLAPAEIVAIGNGT